MKICLYVWMDRWMNIYNNNGYKFTNCMNTTRKNRFYTILIKHHHYRAVQVAVAAGLEALKDARIVTGKGEGLSGWVLPVSMQDTTGTFPIHINCVHNLQVVESIVSIQQYSVCICIYINTYTYIYIYI
jgi:hypothetical protein